MQQLGANLPPGDEPIEDPGDRVIEREVRAAKITRDRATEAVERPMALAVIQADDVRRADLIGAARDGLGEP